MVKIKILFLVLIFLLPFVVGEVECNKVMVMDFNYDGGLLSYNDRVIKCGYAPDRNIQPDGCHRAEIVSDDDSSLYSFRFCIPLDVNFDLSDPLIKSLAGGMAILNETDFALVFPHYDDAKLIKIYNPRGYEVLSILLVEEQFIQKRSWWWILVLILVLLVIGYPIYRHYKKKVD